MHKRSVDLIAKSIVFMLALSGAAAAADKVSVQLDWVVRGNHAMFFVGKDKGFFAENGIEVTEIRKGSGSPDAMRLVGNGNADFGFGDYVEWALDVPMYFVVRDGKYHDCTHVTFRQFMGGALKGEIAEWQPNMGDWTNHLSTLFPDVRLKRFLEMRGADGGPWRRICALPAFWVGLLYDSAALDDAETLTRDWNFEEVQALRNAVPVQALDASFRGRSLWEVGREVVDIARMGLRNRARLNSSGQDETVFLAPLDEMLAKRSTLADDMMSLWKGRWHGDIEAVFDDYQY